MPVDRCDRRPDTDHAHDRRHQDLRLLHLSDLKKTLHTWYHLYFHVCQPHSELPAVRLAPKGHQPRLKLPHLPFQLINICSRCQAHHLQIGIVAHDLERLCTDRTRRAQYRYLFHKTIPSH